MRNKTRRILLLTITGVFNLLNLTASAQDLPGKRDSISSTILKEKRFIQVVLPEKYKKGSTDKYNVLYVLDGEGNTKLFTQIQQFIESESYMPPTIIVGVLNTDRNRDFLPTHVENTKTSGGADKFLSFFKEELIPFINKNYPSDGNNTLFGHSFGGVFVTYALLTEPQLFESYIAADPSYWWDKQVMLKMTSSKLANLTNLNKNLYISGREGDELKEMGIPPMDSLLKKTAPNGLTWKVTSYPNETHGSVKLKSIYDGLKFSYAGYQPRYIIIHPMAGIMLKDKPIKLWFFGDTTKVKYTTDGTEPTLTSAPVKKEIMLYSAGKVTAKLFTHGSRYDKSFTANLKTGTYLAAGKLAKNMKAGGFDYAYYEGKWDKLPDFKNLKPIKSGKADSSFSLGKLPAQNNFALVISGQLEVTEDGYHSFVLSSDDGSRFYLGNQLLIDYDGLHGDDDVKTYIIPLKKGFYPIREEYFQKEGGAKLSLEYLTPKNIETMKSLPIPLTLQYGSSTL
ncbi:hypothetical protein H7F33_08365 [Pedobacter sp. PAMC26386]|nr:hypothetical protein H7F33_08365 [Pedobacter sp. PAMC26386]